MTAPELVNAIEAAGGQVSVDGDRIKYRIPGNAESFLEELRALKPAVTEVLRQRVIAHMEDIVPWMRKNCVARPEISSNPKLLYREFRRARPKVSVNYDTFISVLYGAGFPLGDDGLIRGLGLSVDWDAARERNVQ